MYNDILIIKGDVEPDPKDFPIPKQFGAPGMSFIIFVIFPCYNFSLCYAKDFSYLLQPAKFLTNPHYPSFMPMS